MEKQITGVTQSLGGASTNGKALPAPQGVPVRGRWLPTAMTGLGGRGGIATARVLAWLARRQPAERLTARGLILDGAVKADLVPNEALQIEQLEPFCPAEVVERHADDPAFAEYELEPLRQVATSTANGADQQQAAGLAALVLDTRWETWSRDTSESARVAGRGGQAPPIKPGSVVVAGDGGSYGGGGGYHLAAWIEQHLAPTWSALVVIDSHELPTQDPAKARARSYALRALEIPYLRASGYRPTLRLGCGAIDAKTTPGPQHVLVVNPLVAGSEEKGQRQIAAAVGCLSLPLGGAVLELMRNGVDERRQSRRPYGTIGSAEVATDGDLLAALVGARYRWALLSYATQETAVAHESLTALARRALRPWHDRDGRLTPTRAMEHAIAPARQAWPVKEQLFRDGSLPILSLTRHAANLVELCLGDLAMASEGLAEDLVQAIARAAAAFEPRGDIGAQAAVLTGGRAHLDDLAERTSALRAERAESLAQDLP